MIPVSRKRFGCDVDCFSMMSCASLESNDDHAIRIRCIYPISLSLCQTPTLPRSSKSLFTRTMHFASVLLLAFLCCFALLGRARELEMSPSKCSGSATYLVTNECQWTSMRHPTDYPAGATFSPMCGATHNGAYTMFYVSVQEDGIYGPSIFVI